ncbi:MAG: hypothetical protein HKM86_08850, partial [Deltaproteobacteria bacterium]|nr:hypothetical protein [Deltaproteobacteria bacterium]
VFESRERLLSFYRERDYLKAEVDIEEGEKPGDGRFLKIVIREGEPGYLKNIQFTGNASISAKRLRKQMLSRERGPFRFFTGSGKFDEGEWSTDLAALVGLYQK